ncbi:hypothetical protein [Caballeronia sp. J97]|uniref:hypothetical protein n=1 Tax=Caballeronia sp. J97 TaxID=2805429 RepID=UPI002AB1D86A|nr:hypothetical protein [Caballeronia sp. J97]
MTNTTQEEVFIGTLGARTLRLVDGMHAGNVKAVWEKDGTLGAVVLDVKTYQQFVHPRADNPSPFSVDDVIQALDSMRDRIISEEESRRQDRQLLDSAALGGGGARKDMNTVHNISTSGAARGLSAAGLSRRQGRST